MERPLEQLFAGTDAVAIFYDEVDHYSFERFLRWLMAVGIRSVVSALKVFSAPRWPARTISSVRANAPRARDQLVERTATGDLDGGAQDELRPAAGWRLQVPDVHYVPLRTGDRVP